MNETDPIETWAARINDLLVERRPIIDADELRKLTGALPEDPVLADTRVQKALLVSLRDKLAADLQSNQLFPDKTDLPWLDKLLTAARLQELASARIVKSGKRTGLRYDISALASSFYGRKILDGLSFSRRRTKVDPEEFERIEAACAKIKLTLPQSVEPTAAEQFFAEREGGASP